ncbi:hypothetical protein H0H87_001790 [Tephrocybe sp. NHM501043]|nr:hypothetical protein H0H87_005044 [Tephrocybe sp. NHM501043]KAG6850801.1 hypothetical protein H0H87_001790 [Tephrocybe sp. NHM501043]
MAPATTATPTVLTASAPPEATPTQLTPAEIAEMRRVDASASPIVPRLRVTIGFSGTVLEKDDGKYVTWARAMKTAL